MSELVVKQKKLSINSYEKYQFIFIYVGLTQLFSYYVGHELNIFI